MPRKSGREIYKTVKDQRVVNAHGRSGRKRTIIWWDGDKSYANQINGDGSLHSQIERCAWGSSLIWMKENALLGRTVQFISWLFTHFFLHSVARLRISSKIFVFLLCGMSCAAEHGQAKIVHIGSFILLFSDDNNNSYTNIIWLN